MNLANLEQFDQIQFRKLLGIYAAEQRRQLNLIQFRKQLKYYNLNNDLLTEFETGASKLNQKTFQDLVELYNLNPVEIIKLSKLTQVEYIFDFFRECHAT